LAEYNSRNRRVGASAVDAPQSLASCFESRRTSGAWSRDSRRSLSASQAGFSLIEVMLATMLLAFALTSLAQLMVIAVRANQAAQRATFAATLAEEKMEQLRGLAWGFDDLGLPINDFSTNLANDPATADGVGLQPSPAGALSSNQDGYVDYVDRFGNTIGGGAQPPVNAVYVRRWSVEPLPTNPNNTLILQVLVFQVRDRADDGGAVPVRSSIRDEARLVSVKTRKSR
jgi:prepilin-type N-terminal cleavage/methylation domain-containing protein